MSKPVLTLEAFADWCERQPADDTYDYNNYQTCACAKYAATLGISAEQWIDKAIEDGDSMWGEANCRASLKPYTFGALASRLRAVSQP